MAIQILSVERWDGKGREIERAREFTRKCGIRYLPSLAQAHDVLEDKGSRPEDSAWIEPCFVRPPSTSWRAANQQRACMKILVARDSPEVNKSVTALHRRGLMGFFGINRGAPRHIQTYYYPYYFQSWKVSIQKSLRRTAKVQVVTGVNGLSRSTGPADRWPDGEEVQVDQKGEEIIFPRTSETEAAELMEEYLGRFVNRRYRPVRPPEVNKGKFALIYVPYYVYAREGQPVHKAVLVEGLTGTVGRVKDVPEIAEEVTSTPLQQIAYREGQLR